MRQKLNPEFQRTLDLVKQSNKAMNAFRKSMVVGPELQRTLDFAKQSNTTMDAIRKSMVVSPELQRSLDFATQSNNAMDAIRKSIAASPELKRTLDFAKQSNKTMDAIRKSMAVSPELQRALDFAKQSNKTMDVIRKSMAVSPELQRALDFAKQSNKTTDVIRKSIAPSPELRAARDFARQTSQRMEAIRKSIAPCAEIGDFLEFTKRTNDVMKDVEKSLTESLAQQLPDSDSTLAFVQRRSDSIQPTNSSIAFDTKVKKVLLSEKADPMLCLESTEEIDVLSESDLNLDFFVNRFEEIDRRLEKVETADEKQILLSVAANLLTDLLKWIFLISLLACDFGGNTELEKEFRTKAAVLVRYEQAVVPEYRKLRWVSSDVLLVRQGMKRRSECVGELHRGRAVTLIEKRRNWSLVQVTQNGCLIRGWVFSRYLNDVE